ncbi:MAG TPA: DinB family protein [Dehalococcoidia bacterium]|nr:DinB family protein [Dehalococcoidia bacterium]
MDFPTKPNHCLICDAEVEIPADLFAGMSEMPKIIARAFKEPHAMGSGAEWSPPEVVAHLADIEVSLGWRIRQVLAEDAPMLQAFDQDAWADVMRYNERELAVSLAAYGANRQLNLEILRRAGEPGIQRIYRHPEFGERPLRILVEHIADHDLAHLRQIRGE